MSTGDLPKYAAKGERQKLDLDWIQLLHQEGLPPFRRQRPDPPAKFGQAIREFNRAQYWQCHETLEELWLPGRVSPALVLPWTDQGGGWPPAPGAT